MGPIKFPLISGKAAKSRKNPFSPIFTRNSRFFSFFRPNLSIIGLYIIFPSLFPAYPPEKQKIPRFSRVSASVSLQTPGIREFWSHNPVITTFSPIKSRRVYRFLFFLIFINWKRPATARRCFYPLFSPFPPFSPLRLGKKTTGTGRASFPVLPFSVSLAGRGRLYLAPAARSKSKCGQSHRSETIHGQDPWQRSVSP